MARALLHLLWIPSCSAMYCATSELHLFWDSNCGSDDHPAGWILSPLKPNPERLSNLVEATSGGCWNWANWQQADHAVLGNHSWGSWDGCCTTSPGQHFSVSVDELEDGSVRIAGLCDVKGGRRWANQVYRLSGTTACGRRWYTSEKKIEPFYSPGFGAQKSRFPLAEIVGKSLRWLSTRTSWHDLSNAIRGDPTDYMFSFAILGNVLIALISAVICFKGGWCPRSHPRLPQQRVLI